MLQINQIKLKIPHTEEALKRKIRSILRLKEQESFSFTIVKRSLDARRKPDLYYIYTVNVNYKKEYQLKKRLKNQQVRFDVKETIYQCQVTGKEPLPNKPVVIGMGPAGLFCAYQLAKLGYAPIVFERGEDVDQRLNDVLAFWEQGTLNLNSNVQFGEGGAGTFSDGKLNTLVHDKCGRNKEVLRILHHFGGDSAILYDQKPHLGTDVLKDIVKNMRMEILRLGGEVYFHSQVVDFQFEYSNGENKLTGLVVKDTHTQAEQYVDTKIAVLAVGHSARDTFATLYKKNISMTAKSFAVGVRMEHMQKFINISQYGEGYPESLPAAAYKLTANSKEGRGVYTFCMCPGGYVVNASSVENALAVNGMSYSKRDGMNANTAVIVTITPEDFGETDALAGVRFQEELEHAAYREGCGKIPVQYFRDFLANEPSSFKKECPVIPQMKGAYHFANVRNIFPAFLAKALEEGILEFDKKIPGYADGNALVSGVESRTSSPIRILRDENCLESAHKGLYPCGEGAGYAGGITSAAMDGLKVAEQICQKWRPFDKA